MVSNRVLDSKKERLPRGISPWARWGLVILLSGCFGALWSAYHFARRELIREVYEAELKESRNLKANLGVQEHLSPHNLRIALNLMENDVLRPRKSFETEVERALTQESTKPWIGFGLSGGLKKWVLQEQEIRRCLISICH